VPWVTTAANTAAKTIIFTDLKQQCTEEPIAIENKPIAGESLLDLYTSLRSSSIQEEPPNGAGEEIWNITKEDKYVENNLSSARPRLKSPTGRITGLKLSEFGEEIFFEGESTSNERIVNS
jgi:hypothetical protein